jgi:hypothetical protein
MESSNIIEARFTIYIWSEFIPIYFYSRDPNVRVCYFLASTPGQFIAEDIRSSTNERDIRSIAKWNGGDNEFGLRPTQPLIEFPPYEEY